VIGKCQSCRLLLKVDDRGRDVCTGYACPNPYGLMPVMFDEAFVGSDIEFDTTRKSGWVAQSLEENPVDGAVVMAPYSGRKSADRGIAEVHDAVYVDGVVAGTDGSNWFKPGDGVFSMADAHVFGMVAAARFALETSSNAGSLSSGFHHAKPNRGNGYCTFNGLAVAVYALQSFYRLDRPVAVLDVDAHMGGGTYACVGSNPNVVLADVSTNSFDVWHPSADRHRIWLADRDTYLGHVEAACRFVIKQKPRIVLYNAGMDPFDDGVPATMLKQREELVAGLMGKAGIPVVWCLAGGYTDQLTRDELVGLHRFTVEAFATGES